MLSNYIFILCPNHAPIANSSASQLVGKAMRSVIIIAFSIKIQVGMSFSQKYKFDFDAIYYVYTE